MAKWSGSLLILIFTLGCSTSDPVTEEEIVNTGNDASTNDSEPPETIEEIPYRIEKYVLYYMGYPLSTNFADLGKLITLERDANHRIVQRIGGIYDSNKDPGVGFQYLYSDQIYDQVSYDGNAIILEKKSRNTGINIPVYKRKLLLDGNQRLVQKIIEQSGKIDTVDFKYNESGQISRINSRDQTKPTETLFYFNYRDNLDSLVTNKYDEEGVLTMKTVERFSGYDHTENPTQELFLFEELFYRSLSTNNYSFYQFDRTTITPNSVSFHSTYREWKLKYDASGNIIFYEL